MHLLKQVLREKGRSRNMIKKSTTMSRLKKMWP
jgi:hypothetical protein